MCALVARVVVCDSSVALAHGDDWLIVIMSQVPAFHLRMSSVRTKLCQIVLTEFLESTTGLHIVGCTKILPTITSRAHASSWNIELDE
jgi:hypothetical protein